jgi:hypothetical protein
MAIVQAVQTTHGHANATNYPIVGIHSTSGPFVIYPSSGEGGSVP